MAQPQNAQRIEEPPPAHLGLSEFEAAERLRKFGPNQLPSEKPKSRRAILLRVAQEPMVILLLLCGLLYLFLGRPEEGIPLFASVLLLIGIGFTQQSKSERALQTLKNLSSPRALVLRNGREKRISGAEVVVGDVLILREGDRIAADCELIEATHLKVDESLLTGESSPVEKKRGAQDGATLFSSTLIVAGKALAQVVKTGSDTQVGKIGESLRGHYEAHSRLEKEISSIVRRFGLMGLGVSALIAMSYGIFYQQWAQGLLAAIAAAMSLLPEEFPLVLTLFLSMGAWRISQNRVLARNLRAIETLGSITTLCVDKTGTLTWNHMKMVQLGTKNMTWKISDWKTPLPEPVHELVEFGALASHVDAFDPMDRAIREVLEAALAGTEHQHKDWTLMREYPLCPELMAMACVWRVPDKNQYVIAAKGAPEAVFDLCHLAPSETQKMNERVKEMSTQGLRVLGVAQAEFPSGELPQHSHDFAFRFIGFLGLEDPLREEVPDAIQICRQAGIRVLMMTGDHRETARAIAKRAGLEHAGDVITGPQLELMNDLELKEQIHKSNVFARVIPEHKLRIIKALMQEGQVVGMTGDGVNDAPALKWANVGISMGSRGTDVAREASDLVLLDDDFSSIVSSIRMGRRVYANLAKAMAYIFAVHVPIAGMAILPVLLGLPLILFPAHIVFLELIIDPACTLVFESQEEDGDLMDAPPRRPEQPAFGWKRIIYASLEGISVLMVSLAALVLGIRYHWSAESTRGLVFSTLVLSNIALIIVNLGVTLGTKPGKKTRSCTPLRMFHHMSSLGLGLLVCAILILVLSLQVPFFSSFFQVQALTTAQWTLASGLALFVWMIGKGIQHFARVR